MPKGRSPHRLLAAAATVALTAGLAAAAIPTLAAPSSTAEPTQTVTHHGYEVEVPESWRVVDLADDPNACVRYDTATVYLGHPGLEQDCPTDLEGGSPAITIEALDGTSANRLAADAVRVPTGVAAPEAGVDKQVTAVFEEAGVVVTAVNGADRFLDSASITSHAESRKLADIPRAESQDAAPQAAIEAPGTYTGEGFDACAAPSQGAMDAWQANSPYGAVNIYFGGAQRACAQPNLTPEWVRAQADAGWNLIPTYVGSQAPCNDYENEMPSDPAAARAQGAAEGDDAVVQAQALNLPAGSVLYNDMEGYDSSNTGCRDAVLSFLAGWTEKLHELGYFSGVYSSGGSGVKDLSNNYDNPDYPRPDHIWFAWWNDAHDTNAGSYIADGQWEDPPARIHQYSGGHNETHGGVTINIDGDYLDVVPPGDPGPTCSANLNFGAYPDLESGATGDEVAAAECLLLRQGHLEESDSTYDDATVTAVKAFQAAVGLADSGNVDKATWTALLSAGTTPLLQSGSSGADVERVQRSMIAALGATLDIDGDFGPATEAAVREYQTSRGLAVDGAVGPETWTALQAGK